MATAPAARAQATEENGPPIRVARLSGPVRIDGDLSDPAWSEVEPVSTWFETNPGDNLEPSVHNVARLAYDDEYLYVAFEFDDPDPGSVRSPLGDRDNVPSYTDYGGLILDATNDGKSAQMFLANAAGIQYDALTHDASGEDSSPDFFWESAGRVTERGWQLEMRVPFSSIRYQGANPEQWGVLLYRNRPRDFRYQYFTSRLPRERNCFICNVRPMVGLEGLPEGSHWVVAPYAAAGRTESAEEPGAALDRRDSSYEGGADLKWIPNPDTVIDVAINPDFSQIESDAPVITANERFAIFQPEKRPFFLESVDLFSTPINAVYTRTFTAPRWGARATGSTGRTQYTMLVGQDRGGGSVILPGSNGSDFVDQDFDSLVAIGRVRREFGDSFASFLYSGREVDGGGFNRVLGPDFRWRPNDHHTVTGQLLWSASETPDRPDLADEWDGRELSGHAAELWWQFSDGRWDLFTLYKDITDEFRADNGFVPQVGYREGLIEGGRTFRFEDGKVRRLRVFTWAGRDEDRDGELLLWEVVPGFGLDAALNSFVRLEFLFDEVRGTERTFRRQQIRPYLEVRPGRVLSRIYVQGNLGDQVDFAHDREATGGTIQSALDLRPTDHLQLSLNYDRRWLDVDPGDQPSGRLLTASVARLRGVYTFNARSWLRLIGEWVEIEREPRLWEEEVEAREGLLAGSLVFAYKLNWQTVLYLGYGNAHQLDELETLQETDRQAFLKISYAFRR
ncbi:MAG TPA: DUF5916 domain-containing protein [Thermoanaerobaculia bacterium]|nr:DUF5916 domain-containing protein [Thermoanaerobaculia bacterium]